MKSNNGTDRRTYLALGDSMSIDDYTGVVDGGAVAQFYETLKPRWVLNDKTFDGCVIRQVPRRKRGDLITLTIGGNDALQRIDEIIADGVGAVLEEHALLLAELRNTNRQACVIVGNIYAPQLPLPKVALDRLTELNDGIRQNVLSIRGCHADIFTAFKGREDEYLCQGIEPTLDGATAIAGLFEELFLRWDVRP